MLHPLSGLFPIWRSPEVTHLFVVKSRNQIFNPNMLPHNQTPHAKVCYPLIEQGQNTVLFSPFDSLKGFRSSWAAQQLQTSKGHMRILTGQPPTSNEHDSTTVCEVCFCAISPYFLSLQSRNQTSGAHLGWWVKSNHGQKNSSTLHLIYLCLPLMCGWDQKPLMLTATANGN